MPLSVNATEWSRALTDLTVRSADLDAVTTALSNYDASNGNADRLRAVYQAFERWRVAHYGEALILGKTDVFKALVADFGRLKSILDAPANTPAKRSSFVCGMLTAPSASTWVLTLDQRLKNLETYLEKLRDQIAALNKTFAFYHPVQGVFLAPEYYFAAQGNARAPLSEADYRLVERQLMALSTKFPDILLVPGTLFYAKEMTRPSDDLAAYKINPATGKRDLKKTSNPDRREKIGFQLLAAAKNTQELLGKQAVTDGDHRPANSHHVPSHLALADTILDKSKKPRVARNAAYLFLAGCRFGKYDKQTDFVEAMSNSPDDLIFIPGTTEQCPEVFGLKCGMEICYDHANGVLKRRAPSGLLFHFVVSDWAKNSKAHMAMANGGYFIHASTSYEQTRIFWRSTTGTVMDITMSQQLHVFSQAIGDAYLDLYCLPIPPATQVIPLPPVPPPKLVAPKLGTVLPKGPLPPPLPNNVPIGPPPLKSTGTASPTVLPKGPFPPPLPSKGSTK